MVGANIPVDQERDFEALLDLGPLATFTAQRLITEGAAHRDR